MTELQLGKYEFYPYQFELDGEYEKLLKELELLSLNDKEREKRRNQVRRRLANFKRNNDVASAGDWVVQRDELEANQLFI
jgi:hypothetical protein